MRNPKESHSISIDNISTYGFAAFHESELPEIADDFCVRDIITNVGLDQENTIRQFRIPKRLLIQMSPAVKISSSPHFEISSKPSSKDIIMLLSERAGWNQTEADLESICSAAQDGIFISSYKSFGQRIPLGSGVSLPINEDMCWIGMVLVHPELRRQGIAQSIMNVCLNHARTSMNKSIVGLDATPVGKQVYDSLGFKDSFNIYRSVISTSCIKNRPKPRIEFLTELNLIKPYLTKINYTERIKLTELLSQKPESKFIIAQSDGNTRGFVMSRPGRLRPFIGPLIADTKEVAFDLMAQALNTWKKYGYGHVFMDIPAYHLKSSIFVNEEERDSRQKMQIPVHPGRTLTRMYQLIESHEQLVLHKDEASLKNQMGIKKAIEGYEKTLAFVDKEKEMILPVMYGTSGPEWS